MKNSFWNFINNSRWCNSSWLLRLFPLNPNSFTLRVSRLKITLCIVFKLFS